MIKTMPFYIAKPFKVITVSALLLVLAACGTPPNKPVQTKPVEKVKPQDNLSLINTQTLSVDEIEKLRNQASNNGLWAEYLVYTTQLWHKQANKPVIQAQLEDQAWTIVSSLSSYNLQQLSQSSNPDVQAWADLYNAINASQYDYPIALLNVNTFDKDAIYHKNLLAKLIDQRPQQGQIKQIAVLLPFEGRYKVVGNQIRSGIMKAFFASNQNVTLKFYDTSNLEDVESVYNLAKEEGADRIIGPLRKEAIQQIASFQDDTILALNTVENSSITQFSFKSSDQSLQMLKRFQKSGFKRIGILSNDNQRSLSKAQELQYVLNQANDYTELSVYPDLKPRLRDALGALIHEKDSKERQNNLRWALGYKLKYFPRTREDLDAIVVFDNAHRMAVFRPQFDFFELDTPLYGDSELSPTNFQDIAVNRDLNKVSFLTYPAVLDSADLTSAFEAYGWDSFEVTMELKNLQNGGCLTSGKTGVLSLEGNQIKQNLVWAKYTKAGTLEEAPPVDVKIMDQQNNSKRDSDTE